MTHSQSNKEWANYVFVCLEGKYKTFLFSLVDCANRGKKEMTASVRQSWGREKFISLTWHCDQWSRKFFQMFALSKQKLNWQYMYIHPHIDWHSILNVHLERRTISFAFDLARFAIHWFSGQVNPIQRHGIIYLCIWISYYPKCICPDNVNITGVDRRVTGGGGGWIEGIFYAKIDR